MTVRTWKWNVLCWMALGSGVLAAVPAAGAHSPQTPRAADEFFIISSVDQKKGQIIVKRPTEVTEVLRVDKKTEFVDRQGKKLAFSNLRAGDTVFVTAHRNPDGSRTALRIRSAPMTIEEQRRRYPSLL